MLDIGFSLYQKKPFDENKQLINVEDIETNYVCGRTDTTYSWGECFKFTENETIIPVFQKELEHTTTNEDSFTEKYKYISFEDFKSEVMKAVDAAFEEAQKERITYLKSIEKYKKDIAELRELQKSCTEDQEYAFNKWEEQIRDYKDYINSMQESYNTFDEEDYNYIHAVAVKELLEEMEKYLKENKYYVIPYYSY